MKFKILAIGAVVLICVAAALAADVTGKWTAETQGRNGPQTITFTFKQEGTKLTGTISNPMGESPISEGKVEGDDVSFAQTMSMGGNEIKLVWKGKVSGDEIKFTRTREGGMPGGGAGGGGGRGPGGPQEIVAKRAK